MNFAIAQIGSLIFGTKMMGVMRQTTLLVYETWRLQAKYAFVHILSKNVQKPKENKLTHFLFSGAVQARLTQDVSKKPKLAPKEFDDKELNKLVPIRDIFADKVDLIQYLEKGFKGTELAKVVKFILEENVGVKKSILESIFVFGKSHVRKRGFSFLKTTKLSGEIYGENSEECLLLINWDELVRKVPINDPEKFLTDLQKAEILWIQKLLGAYLSQCFVHHRCAYQLYSSLIGLKMKRGSLD